MQRACAVALVAGGRTEIYNPGHSNDDQAALDIIQRLGAKLDVQADRIIVESQGVRPVAGDINCGESGPASGCLRPGRTLIATGYHQRWDGSLVTRPMDFFDEILPAWVFRSKVSRASFRPIRGLCSPGILKWMAHSVRSS